MFCRRRRRRGDVVDKAQVLPSETLVLSSRECGFLKQEREKNQSSGGLFTEAFGHMAREEVRNRRQRKKLVGIGKRQKENYWGVHSRIEVGHNNWNPAREKEVYSRST